MTTRTNHSFRRAALDLADDAPLCAKCGQTHDRARQRYCRPCHAEYMRDWRKTHRLTGEGLQRARARSYAGNYLDRGMVQIQPCCVCGSSEVEMHHPDHSRPLHVYWLCREHHLAWHAHEKGSPDANFLDWAPKGAEPARIGPPDFVSLETYASFRRHPKA